MSKYGKYIIGVLVSIALVALIWQIVFGGNQEKKIEISYPKEVKENINILASFDKEKYKSNDTAKLDIKVNSNQDANSLMIEVVGMKDRYGNDYFQEKKLVDIQKDSDNNLQIEKQLPTCSSCSGFPEGEYEVEIAISRGSYKLDNKKLSFNLKP